jgi:hypothetical protein
MKTRIAFVNGIWQLCMVVAAMRQARSSEAWQSQSQNDSLGYRDFLVVYTRKTGNFALADFVLELSQTFWNWTGAIEIEWTPSTWNPDLRDDKSSAIQSILRSLGLASPIEVDEVWLCKLQFLDERLFADSFSTAQIVLYEDGLHTYSPTRYLVSLPKFEPCYPKKLVGSYLSLLNQITSGELDWQHEGVKRSHLRRVKVFYSVLGQQIKVSTPFQRIPTEYVSPELLQRFFAQLAADLNCNLHKSLIDRKAALFLGSNLSHLHSFPKEAEAEAFAQAMQQAISLGYTILWKEHPRSRNLLFELITQRIAPEQIICLSAEQKMPVELLLAQSKIDLCCSTLSSSLFYLKSIYGIKTATCVKPLLKYLKGDFYALSTLILATIEQI